jgi:hypothetical protein
LIRALLLAITLSLTAHRAIASDLNAVVDRYIAWRGGPAFEQLKSIGFSADLETAGLKGTEVCWADSAGRQRIDTDLGVLKQTQVIASNGGWDTSPSGQIETLSVADFHNLSREAALQFPTVLRGRAGATAVLAPSVVRAGKTWAVVRVQFGDEETYDVLIDPASGELGGFLINEDRSGRFDSFGDWRWVDGVRMSFLQMQKANDSSEGQTLKINTLTLNNEISGDRLSRPPAVSSATYKAGATSSGWIHFEFYNDNRIFLPARINGHAAMVLLDSGATVSAADKAFASVIGLVSKGSFNAPGAGGIDTTGFANGVEIQIGDAALHGVNVVTFDFKPIEQRIGHPMPFVLGDEFFNAFTLDIDFAHRRLAFRNPNALRTPEGATEVPLVRLKDRSVPVSVEGAPAVPFEFDLGDGSPLDIYPSYYKAHGLLNGRKTSQVSAGGVGGFHPETVATVGRIKFSGVELRDVPTNFTSEERSANNSNLLFGTVGLPILSRFHLIIDYAHDRLLTIAQPELIGAPFAKDRFGATLLRANGLVAAAFVSPDSPAGKAGLRVGDQLQALDNKSIDDWSDAAIATLRFKPSGTVVKLALTDGRVLTVTCRDFF